VLILRSQNRLLHNVRKNTRTRSADRLSKTVCVCVCDTHREKNCSIRASISDARGWDLSGRASSPRRTAGRPPRRRRQLLAMVEFLASSIGRHGGGGGGDGGGGVWLALRRRSCWPRRAASSSEEQRRPDLSPSASPASLRSRGVRRTRGTQR
jgi:hypothetical protein